MSAVIGFAQTLSVHPALRWNSLFSYAWLEAPLAACIARLADLPRWQDLTAWPSGRLFGSLGEYRWQRNADGSLHAVMLLDDPPLPAGFEGILEVRQEDEVSLILWGNWIDPNDPQGNPDGGPRFYANEIPHAQLYPIDMRIPPTEGQAPRLVIRRYRALDKNAGEFSRCMDFTMQGREEEH